MSCWKCGGSGEFVYCPDDMCHGREQCIHGDPPQPCDVCHGEDEGDAKWDDEDDMVMYEEEFIEQDERQERLW